MIDTKKANRKLKGNLTFEIVRSVKGRTVEYKYSASHKHSSELMSAEMLIEKMKADVAFLESIVEYAKTIAP